MSLQRQLFDLAYSINLLGNEGTTFTNGAEKRVKWQAEMAAFKAEATALLEEIPSAVAEPRQILESAAPRRRTAASGRRATGSGRQARSRCRSRSSTAGSRARPGRLDRTVCERRVRGGAIRRRIRSVCTPILCISLARPATCPCSRRATTRRRARSCLADFRQCSPRVIRDSSRGPVV